MKSQEPAGTCWVFSSTTAAEYSYAKQTYYRLGPVAELSPGNLAYFRYNRVDDPLGNTAGDQIVNEDYRKNWPDTGGNVIDAALHFSTWSGIASEKTAPYQNVRDGYSKDDKGKQHWNPDHKPYDDAIAYTDIFILRSFQFVRSMFPGELNPEFLPDGMSRTEYRDYRIRLIKKFLQEHGAVGVSLDISYLSELGVFTLQDPKTYQYNFQYDGSVKVDYPDEKAVYMPGEKTKAANVFINTTGRPITVDAVGFAEFEDNPADYTINVYTGLSDPNDPESGTLAASGDAHTDFMGFQTADLSKKAYVDPGERFSVVFSFGQTTMLGVEMNSSEEDNPSYRLQIDPGQSFYKTAQGEWKDMADVDENGAC